MKKDNYWCRRLKKWRNAKKLTQQQLAKLSNISQSEISQLERGGRKFTQETLDKILVVFKKDYNDLFGTIDIDALIELTNTTKKRKRDKKDIDPQKLRKLPSNIIRLINKSKK